MKKDVVNVTEIIRNFTRFRSLRHRFALVLVCVLVIVTFYAVSDHNGLPDWNFLASLHSADYTEGDELLVTSEFLEQIRSSNKSNILCDFSSTRSDYCEIKGFIQIFGRSSVLNYHSSLTNGTLQAHNGFKIKPHPRKQDKIALARVKELSVEPKSIDQMAPHCTTMHIAPAIVFSTGGYTGNMFHDFTDVLVPLFITSYPFHGQVHFLVREMQPRWIKKYRPLLEQFTRYRIINLDKVKKGLCYPHVIVSLKFHKEMSVDPNKTNNEYSMVNFAHIIRKAFRLKRENATVLGIHTGNKARLLIISRKKTRSFTNLNEIAKRAMILGYEVIVKEPKQHTKLTDFAQIVNSCDVLMGVHGAGLTNLVFLPTNAVVIQVVPLGGLEKLSMEDFGIPARDMKLRYLQYNINKEESTLMEKYPKDHAIFKDPSAIRRKGWTALRSTYLVSQNVKLDVSRFSSTLLEALNFLHEMV